MSIQQLRSHMRMAMLGLTIVALLGVWADDVQALEARDYVLKAQSWIDARADGAYTADIEVYEVDQNGDERLKTTGAIWFQHSSQTGWSYRMDISIGIGDCEATTTYKMVSTPDGDRAFVGNTPVDSYRQDMMVTTFENQSHSSMPAIFYAGDSTQTADAALQELSSNASVTETYLGTTQVYRLSVTWDTTAMNSMVNEDFADCRTAEGATISSLYYCSTSTGAPEMIEGKKTEDNVTTVCRLYYRNISTSPTIPTGTFDIGTVEPSITLTDALQDWYEQNCGE
ncbi:MAG: hypothetical protein CMJ19_01165 [Phycisphaeraceae bacterium]|nr:hypothetical protein [Phycisphaeraceae bacterium]